MSDSDVQLSPFDSLTPLFLLGCQVVTTRNISVFVLIVGHHPLQVGALELLENHLLLHLTADNSSVTEEVLECLLAA